MDTWSDDAFAGYLAAMIDGEGHIEIISNVSVRLRIANTVKETLEAMRMKLGVGKVFEYARPKDRNYKRLFCLEISNAKDVGLVFSICGHLIHMKRDQLVVAMGVVDRVLSEAERLDKRNRAILASIEQGGRTQRSIAEQFGVSEQLVSRIKLGHTWSSVISGHRARALSKKFPKECDQSFRLHGVPIGSDE